MDILVTTPKSEIQTAKEEAQAVAQDPEAFWFRTLRGRPNVQVGDRVYYVENGLIRGYGIVFNIETGDMWDDAHECAWNGTHLKQRKWVWLLKAVQYKGFQGFRYVRDDLKKLLLEAEQEFPWVTFTCGRCYAEIKSRDEQFARPEPHTFEYACPNGHAMSVTAMQGWIRDIGEAKPIQ